MLDPLEAVIGWNAIRLYGNHEILSHRGKSDPYLHQSEIEAFSLHFQDSRARWKEFAPGGTLWKRITDTTMMAARIGPIFDSDAAESEYNSEVFQQLSSSSALFVYCGFDTHWFDYAKLHADTGQSLVDMLNMMANDALTGKTEASSVDIFEQRTSPIWTRDLAEMNQDYVCKRLLPRVLKKIKIARLIVGHTPQFERQMKSLCQSRVILADDTMSRWMFGDPSLVIGNPRALVMKQTSGRLDSIRVLYHYGLVEDSSSPHFFYSHDVGGLEYKPPPLPCLLKPQQIQICQQFDMCRVLYCLDVSIIGQLCTLY